MARMTAMTKRLWTRDCSDASWLPQHLQVREFDQKWVMLTRRPMGPSHVGMSVWHCRVILSSWTVKWWVCALVVVNGRLQIGTKALAAVYSCLRTCVVTLWCC